MANLTHTFEGWADGAAISTAGSGSGDVFTLTTDIAGGSCTATDDWAATGTKSMAFTVGATAGTERRGWAVNGGDSTTPQYLRFYLRRDQCTGIIAPCRGLNSGSSAQRWRVQFDASTGIITFRNNGNTTIWTSTALASTTTYRIEIQVGGTTSSTGRVKIFVGHSNTTSQDSGDLTLQNFGGPTREVWFGQGASATSVSGKVDEVGWSDTAWLGPAAAATPDGLAVAVAAGTPAASIASGVAPAGGAVAVSVGTPTVPGASAAPSGLPLTVAVGAPAVSVARSAAPAGIAVAPAAGGPAVAPNPTTPSGQGLAVAVGTPSATRPAAAPAGVATSVAVGAPSTALNRAAAPAGVALPVTAGGPAAAISGAAPAGLPVPVNLGAPAGPGANANPAGLAVAVAVGTPAVALARTAAPSGQAVTVAPGGPSTSISGVTPSGLAVTAAPGSPATGPLGVLPAGQSVVVVPGPPSPGMPGAAPVGLDLATTPGGPSAGVVLTVTPAGLAPGIACGQPRAGGVRSTVDRPFSGVVTRPGTGHVDRPDAGRITRPGVGTVHRPHAGLVTRP